MKMFNHKALSLILFMVMLFTPCFTWAAREQKTISIKTAEIKGTIFIDSSNFNELVSLGKLERHPILNRMNLVFKINVPERSGTYYIIGRTFQPDSVWFKITFSDGKEQISLPFSFADEMIHSDFFHLFLYASGPSARLPYTVNYEVKAITSFIPVKSMVYLMLSMIVSIFLFQLIRGNNLRKLATVNWNNKVIKTIAITSHFLIAILLLDEIGLLLKEWDVQLALFELSRRFMGLPGVKQLIFLANFGIMVPATYAISLKLLQNYFANNPDLVKNLPEYPVLTRQYSLLTAIFMLTISMMFFLIQLFSWGETGNISATTQSNIPLDQVYLIVTFILPFVLLFKVIKSYRPLNETNPGKGSNSWNSFSLFYILLVLFLSLTQTMITRVILLMNLIGWCRRLLRKALLNIKSFNIFRNANGYDNTDESQIEILASTSFWDKWNFIFLTTGTFIILFIFQSTASPYPPTENSFPKSETISFFYMSFMLLYLIPARKLKWLKSVLWSVYTVFCLHALPLFFPGWFSPILEQPNYSVIEGLELIFGRAGSMFFLLLFHLLLASKMFSFISWHRVMAGNDMNSEITIKRIKKNIILNYFIIIIIVAFFFLFITAGIGNLHVVKFLLMFQWSGINVVIWFSITILLAGFILTVILLGNSSIRDFKADIELKGGNELVEKVRKSSAFLRLFKTWNGKNKLRQNMYSLVLIAIFLLMAYMAFHLPAYLDARKDKLFWHKGFGTEAHYVELNQCSYIAALPEVIYSRRLYTDSLLWESPVKSWDVLPLGDSLLCVYQEKDIVLMHKETGTILAKIPLSLIRSPGDRMLNKPQLLFHHRFLLISYEDQIFIFNLNNYDLINTINGVKHYSSNSRSLVYLFTDKNHLKYIDDNLDIQDVFEYHHAIKALYSQSGSSFILERKNLSKIDSSGNVIWRKAFDLSEMDFIDQLAFDNNNVYIMLVGQMTGIQCIDQLYGQSLWFLVDHQPQSIYNHGWGILSWQQSIDRFPEGLLVRKENDVFLINPFKGEPIVSYKKNRKLFLLDLDVSAINNNILLNIFKGYLASYDYENGNYMGTFNAIRPLLKIHPEARKDKDDFYRVVPFGLVLRSDTLLISNPTGIYVSKLR